MMIKRATSTMIVLLLPTATPAWADQHFSDEVFFDTSLAPDAYPYSSGQASGGSKLALVDGKLPVTSEHVISGPNALRLAWTSAKDGNWSAQIASYRWRNRPARWAGTTVYAWAWSDQGVAARDLPQVALVDLARNPTTPQPLATFTDGIPARKWTRIAIPLDRFVASSIFGFDPARLGALVLSQGAGADGQAHDLFLDDVRLQPDPGSRVPPPVPTGLTATGYERHVLLEWRPVGGPGLAQYVVYRSLNGGAWKPIGVQRAGVTLFSDYIGDPHARATYAFRHALPRWPNRRGRSQRARRRIR